MIALNDVCFRESEIETLAWQSDRFVLTVYVPWRDVPVLTSLPQQATWSWAHLTDDAGLSVELMRWHCEPTARAGLARISVRFRLMSA